MKILGAKVGGVRDILSIGVGALSGGVGLIGTAAKKFLIADDDKWFGKKGLVGLALLFTGVGLLPYVLANPGQPGRDVRDARRKVVQDMYG